MTHVVHKHACCVLYNLTIVVRPMSQVHESEANSKTCKTGKFEQWMKNESLEK